MRLSILQLLSTKCFRLKQYQISLIYLFTVKLLRNEIDRKYYAYIRMVHVALSVKDCSKAETY